MLELHFTGDDPGWVGRYCQSVGLKFLKVHVATPVGGASVAVVDRNVVYTDVLAILRKVATVAIPHMVLPKAAEINAVRSVTDISQLPSPVRRMLRTLARGAPHPVFQGLRTRFEGLPRSDRLALAALKSQRPSGAPPLNKTAPLSASPPVLTPNRALIRRNWMIRTDTTRRKAAAALRQNKDPETSVALALGAVTPSAAPSARVSKARTRRASTVRSRYVVTQSALEFSEPTSVVNSGFQDSELTFDEAL